jgi:hypothetical protein
MALRDIAEKVLRAIVIGLIALWLLPHLLNVYGPAPEKCVDWANSNPTISYVEAYPCESRSVAPLPFKPVEP